MAWAPRLKCPAARLEQPERRIARHEWLQHPVGRHEWLENEADRHERLMADLNAQRHD